MAFLTVPVTQFSAGFGTEHTQHLQLENLTTVAVKGRLKKKLFSQ